jgi:hypothetical protein
MFMWIVKVIDYVVIELHMRFPTHGIINNLGVVYPILVIAVQYKIKFQQASGCD